MATQAKIEIGMWRDSLEARDVAIMTPHFKVVSASPDWDALCDDLAAGINTWIGSSTVQIRTRAYDDEGSPPRAPLGEAFRNKGSAGASGTNRDIALCLSFHGGSGRPTERGRLYAPLYILGIGATGPNASTTTMNKIGALVPILTGLGGLNVDWVVWSQKNRHSTPVTDWHVDNAYDTQRRRGLGATAQVSGTTTEGDTPNLRLLGPGLSSELLEAVERGDG
jgi:hypothetical protein